MDYSFSQLRPFSSLLDGGSSGNASSSGSGGIGHPVMMTERLGTPLHSRSLTSEILFEAYSAPSVVYGIDGLFAFHHRLCSGSTPGQTRWPDLKKMEEMKSKDGLVISMGHWSTTVIPVLAGKGLMDRAKRSVRSCYHHILCIYPIENVENSSVEQAPARFTTESHGAAHKLQNSSSSSLS